MEKNDDFSIISIQRQEENEVVEFREMEDWEKNIFKAVKKGNLKKFKKILKKVDLEKKKKSTKNDDSDDSDDEDSEDEEEGEDSIDYDLNQQTYVRRWINSPDFNKSVAQFTLISYICYLGRTEMFLLLKDRKDVNFFKRDFYDEEDDDDDDEDDEDDSDDSDDDDDDSDSDDDDDSDDEDGFKERKMTLFPIHFLLLGETNRVNKMVEELFGMCDIQTINEGSITALYIACLKGKFQLVRELTKKDGIKVNKGILKNGGNEMSPLYAASVTKNEKIVQHLLKNVNIDVNSGNLVALTGATRVGHIRIVKEILKVKKVDVNKGKEITPLYGACESGDVNIVEELLKNKTIKVNKGMRSPLAEACKSCSIKIINMLLNIKNINVNSGKISPLYNACFNGRVNVVQKLLEMKGIDINKGIMNEKEHLVPLYAAAMSNSIDIVNLLLKRIKIKINYGDYSAIYGAVYNGNMKMLKLLLNLNGININRGICSPLRLACSKGRVKFVHELLSCSGIKINKCDFIKNCRVTPFYEACQGGYIDIVKIFLKREELKVNLGMEEENGNEKSPLFIASRNGHEEIVKLLLNHPKVDVNVGEFTCLQGAVEGGYGDIVTEIFKHPKVDINKGVITPLRQAVIDKELPFVIEILKRKEVDVNVLGVDEEGRRVTALYCAVDKQYVDIVKELLKHPNIDVNKGEWTPIYQAAEHGNLKLVKMLLKMPNIDVNKVDRFVEGNEVTLYSPICAAVISQELKVVKEILKRKDVDVNLGFSSLYHACDVGAYDIVLELLKVEDIEINKLEIEHKCKISPLCRAIMSDNSDIVEKLLEIQDIDVNIGEKKPIIQAAKEGNDEILEMLLERDDIIVNIEETDVNDKELTYTALYAACFYGSSECALALLQDKRIDITSGIRLAFAAACRNGLKDVVKKFLKFDSLNINQLDTNGIEERSALYFACEYDNISIVKMLLKRDDIDVNIGEDTPLYGATKKGNLSIVDILLKRSDIDVNKGLLTPIEGACKFGELKCVEKLLNMKGVIVNAGVLEQCIDKKNWDAFKMVLKVKNIHPSVLHIAFEKALLKKLNEYCILLCMRNLKFNKKRILGKIKKNDELKKIIEEFCENKSLFRFNMLKNHKEKYDLGIKVREFVKVACIFGNGKYEKLEKLNTPSKDASLVHHCLVNENKFDYVKSWIDCDHEDMLDNTEMFFGELRNIMNRKENLKKSLIILFYYAGHGCTESASGQSLLLPIDFKPKYFTKNKRDLFKKVVSMSKLKHFLSGFIEYDCVNIIVLDACRNVIGEDMLKSIAKNEEKKKKKKKNEDLQHIKTRGNGVIEKKSNDNFVYIFSTDPNSVALDSSVTMKGKSDNSPFTQALVENLNRKGNFEDILKNVRNRTMELTCNNQRIWVNSSLSFPIMWKDDVEGSKNKKKMSKRKKLIEEDDVEKEEELRKEERKKKDVMISKYKWMLKAKEAQHQREIDRLNEDMEKLKSQIKSLQEENELLKKNKK